MNTYFLVKQLHQLFAVIVLVTFLVRGLFMLAGSGMLKRPWVTIVTHVNDTLLLITAFYLAFVIGFQDWVIAKLVALVAFVVLAIVALKRGRTKGTRTAAFVAGLVVLAYLFAVAVRKRVIPF